MREQDRRARTFGTFTAKGQGVLTLQGQNQELESWQGLFPKDWPLADLKGRVTQIDVTLKKEIMTKRKIFDKFAEINTVLKELDEIFKFDLN